MEEKKSVFATVKEKWNRLAERTKPGREKFGAICGKTGHVLGTTGKWIYRLRSVFLSVPVVLAAVMLAIKNVRELPSYLIIHFPQIENDALVLAAQQIDRGYAVNAPFILTLICVGMMFISRRMLYPLVIAIFSLVLPLALNFMHNLPM